MELQSEIALKLGLLFAAFVYYIHLGIFPSCYVLLIWVSRFKWLTKPYIWKSFIAISHI